MVYLPTLLKIGGLYLLILISPGPNFFVISQLALNGYRKTGIAVALGITTGSIVWFNLAVWGIIPYVVKTRWLYESVCLIGALFIIWLGFKIIWKTFGVKKITDNSTHFTNIPKPFSQGLITSLANPKASFFWTSVFASLYPKTESIRIFMLTMLMIATLSISWYVAVSLIFSTERVKVYYKQIQPFIDVTCGSLLILFGIQMVLETLV